MKMARVLQQVKRQLGFGVPSIELSGRIDNSDKVSALGAAGYRYSARMRELEQHFEAKASEVRQAYLDEVAEAHGEIEAAE